MDPTIHSSTRSDTSLGKPDCCMQSQHHVFQLLPSFGSSVESPIFCDDNAFCTSYIASSQTTCIQNLLLMPPVVIDLSNRSWNPSFTNVDTGSRFQHNEKRPRQTGCPNSNTIRPNSGMIYLTIETCSWSLSFFLILMRSATHLSLPICGDSRLPSFGFPPSRWVENDYPGPLARVGTQSFRNYTQSIVTYKNQSGLMDPGTRFFWHGTYYVTT